MMKDECRRMKAERGRKIGSRGQGRRPQAGRVPGRKLSAFAKPTARRVPGRKLSAFAKPTARRVPGRNAKEMCHSTKRTHRFLADFLVEVLVNTLVVAESCERNRWVRFGKRTHRRGFGSAQAPELCPSGVGTTRRRLGATLAPRLWGLVL